MNQRAAACLLSAAVTLGTPAVALADSVTYSGVIVSGGTPISDYILLLQGDDTGRPNFVNLGLVQTGASIIICTGSGCPPNPMFSGNLQVGSASAGPPLEGIEVDWQWNGSTGSVHYRVGASDQGSGPILAVGAIPEPSSWALCALGLAGLLLYATSRRLPRHILDGCQQSP